MSASEPNRLPWYRSTLFFGLFGSALVWAALPPLSLGWLGWFAPIPWLLLVRAETLSGTRPYLALYLAGLVFWLATIHWLRLPHPLVYFGWFALSAYLALYLPLFVGLSRVAVHRLRMPLWLAAPVVWTGLELARAHVMTGFLMGALVHSQYRWTTVIQFADLAGEYGVGFLMMLVAACAARAVVVVIERRQGNSLSPPLLVASSLLPAAVALSAALVYGNWRLNESQTAANARSVRIALIQGNTLADWKLDEKRQQQIMKEYIDLTFAAVARARDLGDGRPPDLVVWPETMFRVRLMSFDTGYRLPLDAPRTPEELSAAAPQELARMVKAVGAPVLVGIERMHFAGTGYMPGEEDNNKLPTSLAYNSSILVGRNGEVIGTYDKVHLVMFGEYVPFTRWLPFLNQVSTITGSVEAGKGPVALCTGGVCYVPNICYETVIPHVIRRQVTQLAAEGQPADVLVNLTNDSWYWGSSELEQHLASGVFRAVETRRPLVIAANGGISASIDHHGRLLAQSPKQKPDVIIADVKLNPLVSESFYMRTGDWFAGLCLACCVMLAMIGWRKRQASALNAQL